MKHTMVACHFVSYTVTPVIHPPTISLDDNAAYDDQPAAPNFILASRYQKGKQSRSSKRRRQSW